jgi:hypothetical protein
MARKPFAGRNKYVAQILNQPEETRKKKTEKEKWVAEKLEEASCIFHALAQHHVNKKHEEEWVELVARERERLLDDAELALNEHWDD